ncbi:collagen-binding MSCRAMM adhesin Acm [Enterococcus faecium]|uniref:collagen-binding MSCRAMM adhesin Acm n=1 Tax=Enterococcus faecium TaxID=1352 RepID=UPI0015E3BBE1|nr:collagen-binding MSCRAMM adhesin Acm [Enterococcus faecium]EMF0554963.1 collagen-binding MSCRAMM adhesin Acm [Enterococcus faecium]
MKKCRNIILSMLFIITNITSLIPVHVYADAGRDISSNVTSLTVDPTNITDGGNIKVKFSFDEKKQDIQPGDYLWINWPSEGNIRGEGFQKEIPLMIENKNVGTLTVRKDSAQVVFNENIKNIDSVEGWGQFEIQARNVTDTGEENTGPFTVMSGDKTATVNVTKPASGSSSSVFYYKTGDMLPEDTEHIRWFLNINNDGTYVEQPVKISDEIQSGQRLDPSTFEINQIHLGEQKVYRGEEGIQQFLQDFPGATFDFSVNDNYIEITIPKNFVNLRKIIVSYKTIIETPEQTSFENHSKAWFKEVNKPAVDGEGFNHTVKNISASGGVNGTVRGELKIFKYINGTEIGIPNVTFELRRADEQPIQGQSSILLTSNEQGEVSIKGLQVGDYVVKEKEAPNWIDFDPLSSNELKFSINENDTEGVSLPIYNKKKVTYITATKIWNGGTTPRPSIYFKLFRESTNNWEPVPDTETKRLDNGITSVTWEDIQQYDDSGNEYTFKVQEVDQNGNDYVPSGYQKIENGLVVTNENREVISVSGQKTWEDNENQDGKRPTTITVNLLADGQPIQHKEVSEKDDWHYRFTNLPKYKDGQEIIYTVTEDNVPEYSTTIDGYNIKNSYTPGKTNISIPGSHITPWKNFPEKTEREKIRNLFSQKLQIFAHTGESSEQRTNYISKRAVPKQITNKSKNILPKTSSKKSSFAVIIGLLIVTICTGIFLQKYKKV